jgi:hypothetical protein
MTRSPRADESDIAATGWHLEEVDGGYQLKANTGQYLHVDLGTEEVTMSDQSEATTFEFNKQDYKALDTYTIQIKGSTRFLVGRTNGTTTPSVALGKTGTQPQSMWTVFDDQRIAS